MISSIPKDAWGRFMYSKRAGVIASREGRTTSASERSLLTSSNERRELFVNMAMGVEVISLVLRIISPVSVFNVGSPEPDRVMKSGFLSKMDRVSPSSFWISPEEMKDCRDVVLFVVLPSSQ